ncbi:MAG: hypothetical protein ACYCST_10105 [Acidimicrobiales bacterium]
MTNPLDMATFDARVSRLRSGDDYNSLVADAVNMARCFVGQGGDGVEAEHFLLLAEIRAGAITLEQFREADPLPRSAAR